MGLQGNSVTALSRWSDLTFLQWQSMASGNVGNLQYIVHTSISNKATIGIIDYVTGDQLDGPDVMFMFEPGSENFKALLGTPNAVETPYLLGERKRQLEWKTIKSVRVFKMGELDDGPMDKADEEYTMILEIETHPQAAASGNEKRDEKTSFSRRARLPAWSDGQTNNQTSSLSSGIKNRVPFGGRI